MKKIDLRNKIDRPKYSVKESWTIYLNTESQFVGFYNGIEEEYFYKGKKRITGGGWHFRRLLASGNWKLTKAGWMKIYHGYKSNGPFQRSLSRLRRFYEISIPSTGWQKFKLITYNKAISQTYEQIKIIKNAL